VLAFALRWDSADFLCTTKKLVGFVQEYRDNWGDIAWKEIADIEYEAIDPKQGEAEAEHVEDMHELTYNSKAQIRLGEIGLLWVCPPW